MEELRNKFLYLLVFLGPNQLIKHFWPSWSLIFGIRIDYLSISISLTEVLILVIFILWLLEFVFFNKLELKKIKFDFCLVVLFFLVLVNIFFASLTLNTVISWFKLFLLVWLLYYLVFWNKKNFFDWFFKPASFSLFFFGFLAILQFLKGSTVGGFFYWLGERSFNKNTAGIALFSFAGRDFLRAYSTFSHPNAMAGYFGLCLILFLGMDEKKDFWYFWKRIIFLFGFLIFLFSFSRWAFLSFVFVFIILVLVGKKNFKKTAFLIVSLSFVFSLFLFFIADLNKTNNFFLKSIRERFFLVLSARDVFLKYPLFGVGLNNFILKTSYTFDVGAVNYQLQPVHNIYLLVLGELGLLGFFLFYLFLLKISLMASCIEKPWFFLGLCFVIISGIGDHYWLTLGQTRLLFIFLISQVFRENYARRKNYC